MLRDPGQNDTGIGAHRFDPAVAGLAGSGNSTRKLRRPRKLMGVDGRANQYVLATTTFQVRFSY